MQNTKTMKKSIETWEKIEMVRRWTGKWWCRRLYEVFLAFQAQTIVGLGLNDRFNKNLSMYIQYEAELNSDYTNHTGMMGLRLAW